MLLKEPKQWLAFTSVMVFLVAWYVFIITAPTAITFEDGGELATEPYILGSAHPSGQPLFTVLGKPITLVPLGPISWRTNLFSSLASAAALVVLLLVYMKLGKDLDLGKTREFFYVRLVTGICVCLFTVFSLDYWLQSILTEVYALNALMFILIIYLTMMYHETGYDHYLYLLGFALGLSIGNHHTTIFILPAVIYLVLDRNWRVILDLKIILLVVALAVIGISIYLELPLRSAREVLIDWGDPQTKRNFLAVFFRHQYAPIKVERTTAKLISQLSFFGFGIQQTAFVIWFSFIGMAYLTWRLSRKAIFIFTLFIFYTIGFVYLINPVTPRLLPFLLRTFYLPAYMLLAIMTGLGLLCLMEFVYWLDQRKNWQLRELYVYFSLLLLILPALPARANYQKANRRYYFYTYDYVNNMLKSIKKDSVMFTIYAQDTFPLWYSQFVEGKRPDVVVVHQRLFINEWFRKMVGNFHPDVKLNLRSLRRKGYIPFSRQADLFQSEFIALNEERPMFASQYCRLFSNRFNLKKKGAVYEFLRPDRDYSRDIDPRRYYKFRGFDQRSKYYQMEMRAVEIARDSYLS